MNVLLPLKPRTYPCFPSQEEMEKYCVLVTPGSYCIVEDTKISRWASIGPHEAVQEFLLKHHDFEMVGGRFSPLDEHSPPPP